MFVLFLLVFLSLCQESRGFIHQTSAGLNLSRRRFSLLRAANPSNADSPPIVNRQSTTGGRSAASADNKRRKQRELSPRELAALLTAAESPSEAASVTETASETNSNGNSNRGPATAVSAVEASYRETRPVRRPATPRASLQSRVGFNWDNIPVQSVRSPRSDRSPRNTPSAQPLEEVKKEIAMSPEEAELREALGEEGMRALRRQGLSLGDLLAEKKAVDAEGEMKKPYASKKRYKNSAERKAALAQQKMAEGGDTSTSSSAQEATFEEEGRDIEEEAYLQIYEKQERTDDGKKKIISKAASLAMFLSKHGPTKKKANQQEDSILG